MESKSLTKKEFEEELSMLLKQKKVKRLIVNQQSWFRKHILHKKMQIEIIIE